MRPQLTTNSYLGDPTYLPENTAWCAAHHITLHHFLQPAVKEPFLHQNPDIIAAALHILLDRRNYPVLVHSNKGKHRAGVLVGCMRRVLQGWSLAATHAEYDRYAGEKGEADLEVSGLFLFSIFYYFLFILLFTFYFIFFAKEGSGLIGGVVY